MSPASFSPFTFSTASRSSCVAAPEGAADSAPPGTSSPRGQTDGPASRLSRLTGAEVEAPGGAR